MRMEVHIERVVLEGLPVGSHDGQRVQQALTAELERLIGAREISSNLWSGGAVPAIRAEVLQIATRSSPRRLGTQIARAVYAALERPE